MVSLRGGAGDSRAVYVSSAEGNDGNDGLSLDRPKRTIAAGKALLRHSHNDRLLLRRSDEWREPLGQWKVSGRDLLSPVVVGAYGEGPRPRLLTGAQGAIWTNGGGGSPATIDHVVLRDLDIHPDEYAGGGECVGVHLLQPGAHWSIERCRIDGYSTNVVLQGGDAGRLRHVVLHRCEIDNAWSIHTAGSGHSQGLYAYGVDGLTLDECKLDHNGWNENVAGAGADIYSHNLYIDNGCTHVLARRTLIANGASHGMQLRCGGKVDGCTFIWNAIALSVGGGNAPELGGVEAEVRNCKILAGRDIDAENPRGWGMWFGNVAHGLVEDNAIVCNRLGTQPSAMILDGRAKGGIGVHNLSIARNVIYDWAGGISVQGDDRQIGSVLVVSNVIQGGIEYDDESGRKGVTEAGNRFVP